jgi:hypothetical protein
MALTFLVKGLLFQKGLNAAESIHYFFTAMHFSKLSQSPMPSRTSEDEKSFNDHIMVDIWIMPIIEKAKA